MNLMNLSRGSNVIGSTLNFISFFKKPIFGGFETRLKFIKFGICEYLKEVKRGTANLTISTMQVQG